MVHLPINLLFWWKRFPFFMNRSIDNKTRVGIKKALGKCCRFTEFEF